MSANMTDAEVWLEIAEHMRGSGELPTCSCGHADGLCEAVNCACRAGVISTIQHAVMQQQLRKKFYPARSRPYWWPIGDIKSRIAACEQLARECMQCKP